MGSSLKAAGLWKHRKRRSLMEGGHHPTERNLGHFFLIMMLYRPSIRTMSGRKQRFLFGCRQRSKSSVSNLLRGEGCEMAWHLYRPFSSPEIQLANSFHFSLIAEENQMSSGKKQAHQHEGTHNRLHSPVSFPPPRRNPDCHLSRLRKKKKKN